MSFDRKRGPDPVATDVSAASFSALRDVLGDGGIERHEKSARTDVDGVSLGVTLQPADGESLAATLLVLGEQRLAAVVRGGGTQLGLGNPPSAGDVLLSTERMTELHEFDSTDGVVHAAAGLPVRALAARVRSEGWELPLESARPEGTVGGALAVAAAGPRRLGLGRARDTVLGLTVALPSGERTSCGGRVVKNVTGYDLGKLYTGSLGTLAVIESAWLRLRPLPTASATLGFSAASGAPDEHALKLAVEASRRSSARSVAWVSPEISSRIGLASAGSGWVLLAEYAADRPSVAEDSAWLEEAAASASLASIPVDGPSHEQVVERPDDSLDERVGGLIDRLAIAQTSGRVRARLAALPSRIGEACAPLFDAGVGLILHPGTGFVYVMSNDTNAQRILSAVDTSVARVDADVRFEQLPTSAKAGRDVFGDPGERLPLLRALKHQFDPAGTLNPGRSQGCI